LIWEQKLVIAEQTCLLEEKFSKNGVQKNVHVVVKNTPFTITLVLLDKQSINFNQFSADVQLVYDCSTLKEVDFVKLKPMEFKLKPSDEGDQLAGMSLRSLPLRSYPPLVYLMLIITQLS
jgi:hypothetical protein